MEFVLTFGCTYIYIYFGLFSLQLAAGAVTELTAVKAVALRNSSMAAQMSQYSLPGHNTQLVDL